MESWVVFLLAGGGVAGCMLDSSLTNIQWLGKMSSDGLGPCSVKQELEEKENCHLEQNRVKVNCRHSFGKAELVQGISKGKESRSCTSNIQALLALLKACLCKVSLNGVLLEALESEPKAKQYRRLYH